MCGILFGKLQPGRHTSVPRACGYPGLTADVKHVRGDRRFCVWSCLNNVRRIALLWRAFWHSIIIIRKKERESLTAPSSLICQESHKARVGGLLLLFICGFPTYVEDRIYLSDVELH